MTATHPERAAEIAEIRRLSFSVAVTGQYGTRLVMERFGVSQAQAKRDIKRAKQIAGAA